MFRSSDLSSRQSVLQSFGPYEKMLFEKCPVTSEWSMVTSEYGAKLSVYSLSVSVIDQYNDSTIAFQFE